MIENDFLPLTLEEIEILVKKREKILSVYDNFEMYPINLYYLISEFHIKLNLHPKQKNSIETK